MHSANRKSCCEVFGIEEVFGNLRVPDLTLRQQVNTKGSSLSSCDTCQRKLWVWSLPHSTSDLWQAHPQWAATPILLGQLWLKKPSNSTLLNSEGSQKYHHFFLMFFYHHFYHHFFYHHFFLPKHVAETRQGCGRTEYCLPKLIAPATQILFCQDSEGCLNKRD